MKTEYVDVLVIGGGPAGLAAALAAKLEGAERVLIIEREDSLGGILRQCIHTGFGLHRFKSELTGPEYAKRDIDRIAESGVEWRCGTMVLSLTPDHCVETINPRDGLQLLRAGSIVLAMGCRERPAGALAIAGSRCSGIMTAGTAQRFVNLEGLMPGRRIIILGSGDIGLIMARRLASEGAQVLACVEIQPCSSGLQRNIVQCLDDFDIPLLLSHTVIKIEGRRRLSSVTIARVDERLQPVQGTEKEIACDTLLVSVGLIPETELARDAGIELSPLTGGPVVDANLAISLPGIFACGNVLRAHDLVDDVSSEGDLAGRQAAAFARHSGSKYKEA